jgi:hypothetical protein
VTRHQENVAKLFDHTNNGGNGWPVVVFGHGGNGTSATTPLEIASIPASRGLALICINLVGHGRGPASTLPIKMRDGSSTTLPMPGRGFDQNGDGMIATAEGHYATAPRLLGLYTDAVTQIGADQLSLVRHIQRGIDADGDGQIDLNPTRIYSLGQSFGALTRIPFAAYTQAVRASFFLFQPELLSSRDGGTTAIDRRSVRSWPLEFPHYSIPRTACPRSVEFVWRSRFSTRTYPSAMHLR